MTEIERRVTSETWTLPDLDLRVESDGFRFSGYAAVFDSPSEPLPYVERIRPGAFTKSLGERRDIRMFVNHDSGALLGSRKAGTLRLTEDERGLKVEADLNPNTTTGRDMAAHLARGDVYSMSFGFQAVRDSWVDDNNRELIEARLWEVSPVTGWPAYPDTAATVRHLADIVGVEEGPLLAAFRALTDPDARLTIEQRDLLAQAINVRTDAPMVYPTLASYRERFAALA